VPIHGLPPPVIVAHHKPHAVFTEVAPARHARVYEVVRERLEKALPSRSKSVDSLIALVGSPRFYDEVARVDPSRAADWITMGRVQRQFHDAEPGFDGKTRAYSESMRVTLHAALIQHLADPSLRGKDRDLFEMFLELHVTAFHENGAWLDNMQIPWPGALEVVRSTPLEMAYHGKNLLDGSFVRDAATIRAAEWVRQGRRAALG
jgi:hypothetical protein